MSRIPLVEPEAAQPEVKAIYERLQSSGFDIFNVMKVFANDVQFLAGFEQMLYALYADETLPARYRELAWLRTSSINQCHY